MRFKQNLSNYHARACIVGLLALGLLAACSQTAARLTPTSGSTSGATVPATPAFTSTSLPSATPLPTGTATPVSTVAPQVADLPSQCNLAPVVVPTLPAVIPGYTKLDETTHLHMTGKYQVIDLASYRLEISGKVEHPLLFSYDQLRCLPKVTQHLTLTCPGFFSDEATWSGVPLEDLLQLVVVKPGSTGLRLISADGYFTAVQLEDVRTFQPYLAYEWQGQPLPILHGFPLRAVFPTLSGGRWVKWLVKIEVY